MTILPRVEALNISKLRNVWGNYVVTGMCEGYRYEWHFDHKPRPHEARRAIREAHKKCCFVFVRPNKSLENERSDFDASEA